MFITGLVILLSTLHQIGVASTHKEEVVTTSKWIKDVRIRVQIRIKITEWVYEYLYYIYFHTLKCHFISVWTDMLLFTTPMTKLHKA